MPKPTIEQVTLLEREWAEVTLRSISDAVIRNARVTYLNPAAEQLTGWSSAEALGRDGSTTTIKDSAAPIHDGLGEVAGGMVIIRDITATRALDARILHLAEHDSLTDLPNRVLLSDRLSQAMAFAVRHHTQLALQFLALDRFQHINDSHGHSIGDGLLQSVAERLTHCVRHPDTVRRQGGDEFVIVLNEITHARDAATTAEKISTAVSAPHLFDSHSIYVTVSIGIVTYPR